jgi:hypothetical protein
MEGARYEEMAGGLAQARRCGPAVGERKRAGPNENNALFFLFKIFQEDLN